MAEAATRNGGWGTGSSPVALREEPRVSIRTQSDLSVGLDHSPETMKPAHRKRPHLWVQGSERILFLAGGCFSPEEATVLQKLVGDNNHTKRLHFQPLSHLLKV